MRYEMNAKAMVEYLMHFIGLPYHWGGDDPIESYDCSGLTVEGLKSVGFLKNNDDMTAQGLYNISPKTTEAAEGVLAFHGKDKEHITHVGICINKSQMLEAGGGNEDTTTPEIASKQNAFIRIRTIKSRGDLVGFADPFYLEDK